MRKTTPVCDYMSHLPEEIDRREKLSTAIERMEAQGIRHLPVMDGPHVFGILSRKDVQAASLRHGASARTKSIGDVCTRDPMVVAPFAPIPTVARQMLEKGVTSVLVVDEGVLVGIFTSVDALRVLSDL
jgi:acetoin utilization protein AcuB